MSLPSNWVSWLQLSMCLLSCKPYKAFENQKLNLHAAGAVWTSMLMQWAASARRALHIPRCLLVRSFQPSKPPSELMTWFHVTSGLASGLENGWSLTTRKWSKCMMLEPTSSERRSWPCTRTCQSLKRPHILSFEESWFFWQLDKSMPTIVLPNSAFRMTTWWSKPTIAFPCKKLSQDLGL